MIVLDANILIRAVLGRKVRALIEMYSGQGVRFIAPDSAFKDAEAYLPATLKKFHKEHIDVTIAFRYLRQLIETLDDDLYLPFEPEARMRCEGVTKRIGLFWLVHLL